MTEYNFRIGQLVYFHPKRTGRSQVDAAAGPYQIVKRLPAAEDGEFHYEIRSAVEDHSGVASRINDQLAFLTTLIDGEDLLLRNLSTN